MGKQWGNSQMYGLECLQNSKQTNRSIEAKINRHVYLDVVSLWLSACPLFVTWLAFLDTLTTSIYCPKQANRSHKNTEQTHVTFLHTYCNDELKQSKFWYTVTVIDGKGTCDDAWGVWDLADRLRNSSWSASKNSISRMVK